VFSPQPPAQIPAEAEAERIRRHAKGDADAILLRYEAEARGIRQVLESKAAGYESLVRSTGDARAAATLLLIEKLEEIVARQVEAIRNLKIDKITVWDSGAANGHGSSTASFLSSLVASLPPLQEIAKMAGIELPEYLGRMAEPRGDAGPPPPPSRG
jgi:flotillin